MIRAVRWLLVVAVCTAAFWAARPWRQIADGLSFVLAGAVIVVVISVLIVAVQLSGTQGTVPVPGFCGGTGGSFTLATCAYGGDKAARHRSSGIAFMGDLAAGQCVTYDAGRTLCNRGSDNLDCTAAASEVICDDDVHFATVWCQSSGPDGPGSLVECQTQKP